MNVTSTAIVPLDRLTPVEQAHAGAKAANCARLKQAGFPVPDGLIVMAHATAQDLASIARHPWFDAVGDDARFAVRSSGIGEDGEGESFAGVHETVLDVPRSGLAEAIETCFASSRSPQALEYRRAKGLPTETIEMALLIQHMVYPIAAGVAFTVNPVSGAQDEIVINSSWGLGEALVSGRIEPDEFVVYKRDGKLKWSRIGQKGDESGEPIASLGAERLRDLASMLTKIEQHYGSPQDVEWCLADDGLWIVQSRPVTTRRANTQEIEWPALQRDPASADLRDLRRARGGDSPVDGARRHDSAGRREGAVAEADIAQIRA
jgi:phosphoenolpyruvate synthase/pyruvate phosphate dikinase